MSEAEEKAGERRKGPIADISEFSRERGWKEGMGILQLPHAEPPANPCQTISLQLRTRPKPVKTSVLQQS